MLYSRRGALTSSSVNSPFVFTTVVPRAAPRDQHAAVNYASKPRLELEPAELNVWPICHRSNPHYWRERTSLLHRPSSRWRALLEISPIISAVLQRAFDFSRKLRFDGAARLVKFRFRPRQMSQHCWHALRTEHDKSERDKELVVPCRNP